MPEKDEDNIGRLAKFTTNKMNPMNLDGADFPVPDHIGLFLRRKCQSI
jgi:hypothetical protein